MVCVALQELTVTCNFSGDNGYKITLLPRWAAIINTRQSSSRTHTLTHWHCTQNIWWLVLGWVTAMEDHPRLRKAYTSYIWRVIKFYLQLQLGECTGLLDLRKERDELNRHVSFNRLDVLHHTLAVSTPYIHDNNDISTAITMFWRSGNKTAETARRVDLWGIKDCAC